MKPLAQACNFQGSERNGIHKWRIDERIRLRAELDAAFALLYDVNEDDFNYMLSTFPSVPEDTLAATRDAYRELQKM